MSFRRTCTSHLVGFAVALSATFAATGALARSNIATDSAVYVERVRPGNVRQLEPVAALRRGDRVVTIVSWYRLGGNGGFVITNPMPRSIAFQRSARDGEEVSVDGGRTWGRLGELQVGTRLASPEDVTHVRWRISQEGAAGGSGHIAYSGIVR